MSSNRKRIVAAALMLVALGLGFGGYVQVKAASDKEVLTSQVAGADFYRMNQQLGIGGSSFTWYSKSNDQFAHASEELSSVDFEAGTQLQEGGDAASAHGANKAGTANDETQGADDEQNTDENNNDKHEKSGTRLADAGNEGFVEGSYAYEPVPSPYMTAGSGGRRGRSGGNNLGGGSIGGNGGGSSGASTGSHDAPAKSSEPEAAGCNAGNGAGDTSNKNCNEANAPGSTEGETTPPSNDEQTTGTDQPAGPGTNEGEHPPVPGAPEQTGPKDEDKTEQKPDDHGPGPGGPGPNGPGPNGPGPNGPGPNGPGPNGPGPGGPGPEGPGPGPDINPDPHVPSDPVPPGGDQPHSDPVSVPEPGMLGLLGVGLAALAMRRRRKSI